MSRSRKRNIQRGQILPLIGVVAIGLFAIIGLAVDVGRMFIAKAELSRSVDAAALAAVLELPSLPNAETKVMAYMAKNQPDASVSTPSSPGDNQLKVTASKSVDMYFLSVLGIGSVTVTAQATAGFGIQPVDAYLALDATGSMHNGCNSEETNTGGDCPIKEARDAAKAFVDTLIGPSPTGYTVVGAGAFRGCHNLPRNNVRCIDVTAPGSMITGLTSNKTTIKNGINDIFAIGGPGQPTGGSGTNICLALKKGQEVVMPPASGAHTASNTRRYIIVLSDGDNVYNATQVNQSSPQSPESPCRPTSPGTSDADVSASCRTAANTAQARKVDALSYDMANTLKGQGIEIYVIGLSPCGHTTDLCDTSKIGTALSDAQRNENLLKCIASSNAGTNDHYFYTNEAADLPSIFTTIAQQIAHRLIE
jgi:Flp pilus assembly protein TadG